MSVTDQSQSKRTAGGLVGDVIPEAEEVAGSAVGRELARGPKSWSDDWLSPERWAVRLRSADRRDGTREATASDVGAEEPDVDSEDHDPVHRVAREVVGALIETRWSLHAASVVVALRRLCETVQGEDA